MGEMLALIVKALVMGLIYYSICAVAVLTVIILLTVYIVKSRKAKKNGVNINSPKYTVFRIVIYVTAGAAAIIVLPLLSFWLNKISV